MLGWRDALHFLRTPRNSGRVGSFLGSPGTSIVPSGLDSGFGSDTGTSSGSSELGIGPGTAALGTLGTSPGTVAIGTLGAGPGTKFEMSLEFGSVFACDGPG